MDKRETGTAGLNNYELVDRLPSNSERSEEWQIRKEGLTVFAVQVVTYYF